MIQNYLLDAVNGAWAAGLFSNGGFDAFNSDTIGTNSTGQTYEAGKYYDNPSVAPTTSYANAGGTGNRSGIITVTASGSWESGTSGPALVDGVKNVNGASSYSASFAGMYLQFDYGVGATKYFTEIKEYYGNSSSASITAKWQGSNDGSIWSDMTATYGWGGGTTMVRTVTGNYGPWRYTRLLGVSGTDTAGIWLDEVDFEIGTTAGSAPNMTLVSSALSPAPATALSQVKLMVLWKDMSASAVLNTDVTAEATRDGSTWTIGTLTDTGLTVAGFKVLWAVIDVSGQPSGTTVKYRLKTANAKTQQVKGVGLMTK